jgi:hypothetical protein
MRQKETEKHKEKQSDSILEPPGTQWLQVSEKSQLGVYTFEEKTVRLLLTSAAK